MFMLKKARKLLDRNNFDIVESYARSMSSQDKRTVRAIILKNFEVIIEEWDNFHGQGGKKR